MVCPEAYLIPVSSQGQGSLQEQGPAIAANLLSYFCIRPLERVVPGESQMSTSTRLLLAVTLVANTAFAASSAELLSVAEEQAGKTSLLTYNVDPVTAVAPKWASRYEWEPRQWIQ